MEKIQALWARFKVQVSFVAGCLVVATSMGTCSFDPATTSEDAAVETVLETEATEALETEVAATEAAVVETVEAINDAAVGTVDVETEGGTELTDETVATETE